MEKNSNMFRLVFFYEILNKIDCIQAGNVLAPTDSWTRPTTTRLITDLNLLNFEITKIIVESCWYLSKSDTTKGQKSIAVYGSYFFVLKFKT